MPSYIKTGIIRPVSWLGDSRRVVKAFPASARQRVGVELFAVQLGAKPSDWKPLPSVGLGVNEIRVHAENEYRVVYVAKFAEAVYVLHAFQKKTQATSQRDIDLARQRYRALLGQRK